MGSRSSKPVSSALSSSSPSESEPVDRSLLLDDGLDYLAYSGRMGFRPLKNLKHVQSRINGDSKYSAMMFWGMADYLKFTCAIEDFQTAESREAVKLRLHSQLARIESATIPLAVIAYDGKELPPVQSNPNPMDAAKIAKIKAKIKATPAVTATTSTTSNSNSESTSPSEFDPNSSIATSRSDSDFKPSPASAPSTGTNTNPDTDIDADTDTGAQSEGGFVWSVSSVTACLGLSSMTRPIHVVLNAGRSSDYDYVASRPYRSNEAEYEIRTWVYNLSEQKRAEDAAKEAAKAAETNKEAATAGETNAASDTANEAVPAKTEVGATALQVWVEELPAKPKRVSAFRRGWRSIVAAVA